MELTRLDQASSSPSSANSLGLEDGPHSRVGHSLHWLTGHGWLWPTPQHAAEFHFPRKLLSHSPAQEPPSPSNVPPSPRLHTERKEAESLAFYSPQERASALWDGVGRARCHFLGGRGVDSL